MKRFFSASLAGPGRWTSRGPSRHQSPTQPSWPMGLCSAAAVFTLTGLLILHQRLPRKAVPGAAASQAIAHPTVLPWIQTEAACLGQHRRWKDGFCFDSEHDPTF